MLIFTYVNRLVLCLTKKNMKRNILYIFLLTVFLSYGQNRGVGINELVPEQELHLGSQTGTIRVEGLNAINNDYNGGKVDTTYPLYVDSNGDMTLEVSAYENNDGEDQWVTTGINGTVTIDDDTPVDGYEVVEILDIPITVDRDVVVELKYSLSMEVFKNKDYDILRDSYARNITNFFTLDEVDLTATVRRYGQSSKCYFNKNDYRVHNNGSYTNTPISGSSANAATGFIYNSGTTYIPLAPGTHTLRFYGSVCSGVNNQPTHIRFAGGPDAIFVRIY